MCFFSGHDPTTRMKLGEIWVSIGLDFLIFRDVFWPTGNICSHRCSIVSPHLCPHPKFRDISPTSLGAAEYDGMHYSQSTGASRLSGYTEHVIQIIQHSPIRMEGRKVYVLFNDALNTFYFTVIWRQTYGKGPFRERERKAAAATWATLSD